MTEFVDGDHAPEEGENRENVFEGSGQMEKKSRHGKDPTTARAFLLRSAYLRKYPEQKVEKGGCED